MHPFKNAKPCWSFSTRGTIQFRRMGWTWGWYLRMDVHLIHRGKVQGDSLKKLFTDYGWSGRLAKFWLDSFLTQVSSQLPISPIWRMKLTSLSLWCCTTWKNSLFSCYDPKDWQISRGNQRPNSHPLAVKSDGLWWNLLCIRTYPLHPPLRLCHHSWSGYKSQDPSTIITQTFTESSSQDSKSR